MWRIVGASVVGASHIASGLPCQDAHRHEILANGVALAAVADGLGTAAKSDLGARLAVETVLNELAAQLRRPLPPTPAIGDDMKARMAAAFAAARGRLEQAAEDESVSLRDLGTTLMAVACGPKWLLVGHLGDGAVIGRWSDDELSLVSEPQRGEYANVTMPLTMDDALARVQYFWSDDAPATVLLMSDGLQNLALDLRAKAPFEGFVRPLIDGIARIDGLEEANQALIAFLESERVNSRTDDDKTLVILWRVANAPTQVILPPPAYADTAKPGPQSDLAPPRDANDTQASLEAEAAALEAEADELEREARANRKRGQELAGGLEKSAAGRRHNDQTWKTVSSYYDLANHQSQLADEKRARAQALRRSRATAPKQRFGR